MSRWKIGAALYVAPALLGIGSLGAQTPASAAQQDAAQLSKLTKQVAELRIEVAKLRLAWHEQRMQTLEKQIRGAERESRLAEYEDAAARDELLAAEMLLAGSELEEAERAELTGLKSALLTEGQQRVRNSRTETAERESALRSEWEREKSSAEESRQALHSLRSDPAATSALKAAQ